MLRKRQNLITKLLILAMCTSLVPTTIAFAEETDNTKEIVTSGVQTTGTAVGLDEETTTEEETNAESDFIFNANTGEITKYIGTDVTVVIPSTINGILVTQIGSQAFYQCGSIISIEIPKGVTRIQDYAFTSCDNLKSINVSSNNNNYTSVDGVLFDKLKTEIIIYPATKDNTSYVIPDSVTRIEHYAFYRCSSLTNIEIPSSVIFIGVNTFASCTNLKSINVNSDNNNYTSVDGVLFDKLKTEIIRYPEARDNTSYVIPDTVKTIGFYAFNICNFLATLEVPSSVTSIGFDAFRSCPKLENIIVDANNDNYLSVDGVLFNKLKTKIIKYPDSKDNISYVIPDGVTGIGLYAFYGCKSLASITISNSVTTIGECAFYDCESLTSITVPNSVLSIAKDAFENCYNAVFHVYNQDGKQQLIDIGIDESKIIINEQAVLVPNAESDFIFDETTGTIKEYRGSDNTVVIPSTIKGISVNSIGEGAFDGFITLPEPEPGFYPEMPPDEYVRLKSITIPDNVTKLGAYAFYNCDNVIFYVKSERVKQLLIDFGIAENKIVSSGPVEYVTKITLNYSGIGVQSQYISWIRGKTNELIATVSPSFANNKGVTWESSNTAVATVDENGIVTYVGVGTATITCTAKDGGGTYATCLVTLKSPDTELFGDANNDSEVNILDYIRLKKYLTNNAYYLNLQNADINKDGKINILDYLALKKIIQS